jgi:hypothetical protein
MEDYERSPLLGMPQEKEKEPPQFWIAFRLAFFSWGCYLCMYGMRKPWAALQYVGDAPLLGMHPKVAIAVAQIIGYFMGKLLGIKLQQFVTSQRLFAVLVGIGVNCTVCWFLFYALPRGALSLLAVMIGSFPLASLWSLIYRYIEGRRCSDFVGGVFGTSVIMGPGVSKLAGSALAAMSARLGMNEWAVPFIATAFFFLPGYLVCIVVLSRTPPPTASEVAEMGDRTASTAKPTAAAGGGADSFFYLLITYWPGVLAVGVFNACMLATREVRDTFQPEIWEALYGHVPEPITFIFTEIPATLIVLFLCQRISSVRSPHSALKLVHALMIGCGCMFPLINFLRPITGGAIWFMGQGASLSLGAVIVSSCYFDRVIAAMRSNSSAGVLIQAADMLGYIGSLTALYFVERMEESDDAMESQPPPGAHDLLSDGWERTVGGGRFSKAPGGAAPVTEPSAVTLLQVAAQAGAKGQQPTGHMLPMVEAIFYAMGPAAIITAAASWLYWTHALKEHAKRDVE